MQFRKILCPIDFSAGSQRAMRIAAQLATRSDAELVLAHSAYVPAVAFSGFSFPESVIQQMSDDSARELENATRDAKQLGVARVSSLLLRGDPWREIVGVVERDPHVDLVVIGTHGRTGISRILLGSVAEKVVRHAPCSVLAVRPDTKLEPFVHALCPTDLSPSAEYAAELAAKLVPVNGALTLLHVIEIPARYSGALPVEGLERVLDSKAAEALDASATTLRAITKATITTQWRIGYAGVQTLAALDRDPSIDVVVMGSHGRTSISRAILGSVAEKMVRHAHCPVLIARRRPTS